MPLPTNTHAYLEKHAQEALAAAQAQYADLPAILLRGFAVQAHGIQEGTVALKVTAEQQPAAL